MCNIKKPKIKIVGIGGAGCALINRLLENAVNGVEYYVADADDETLKLSNCANKIEVLSIVDDCGGCLKTVQQNFRATLADTDMAIVVSGLGGHIGSTCVPIFAEIAKDLGIPVLAVVSTPFEFEGKSRMAKCAESLEKLKHYIDTTVIVPSHKLRKLVANSTSMRDALTVLNAMINDIILNIVEPICESGLVNIDFNDVVSALKNGRLAYWGVGGGKGDNKVHCAVNTAAHNPMSLLKIGSVKKLLVSIIGGNDLTLETIKEIGSSVRQSASSDASIVFLARIKQGWADRICVSILGTENDESIISTRANGVVEHSTDLKCVLMKAHQISEQCNCHYVASEQVVYAMLLTKCKARDIMQECEVKTETYERFFLKSIHNSAAINGLTPRLKMILQHAKDNVILKKGLSGKVGTEDVLYAALSSECLARQILSAMNIDMKRLLELLKKAINS